MTGQEQPYSEWMEELELACEFGWDQEERERALRELRQRDEELARLRARVEELEKACDQWAAQTTTDGCVFVPEEDD